ncbi:MAG: hypothetical protein K9L30_01310 [Desulfobacterales bacterium]|nr:hypothetical protein [Desulfobacterales bacterium]
MMKKKSLFPCLVFSFFCVFFITSTALSFEETPIEYEGDIAFIEVTVGYKGKEALAKLRINEASADIAVSRDIASTLDMVYQKDYRLQFSDGKSYRVGRVIVDYLIIGPHKIENPQVYIPKEEVPTMKNDGILGMSILSGHSYKIMLAEPVIRWED